MDYPILENGAEIGRLYARQEGLYTVLEARLPQRAGLTRLYLVGEKGVRALGLMEPGGGGCTLVRRLSRRELPGAIRCASTTASEPKAKRPQQSERGGWREGERGLLYDPERRFVAFPAGLRAGARGMRTLSINGKEYIVFRW